MGTAQEQFGCPLLPQFVCNRPPSSGNQIYVVRYVRRFDRRLRRSRRFISATGCERGICRVCNRIGTTTKGRSRAGCGGTVPPPGSRFQAVQTAGSCKLVSCPRASQATPLEFGRFLATAERSNRIAQAAVAEAKGP